MKSDILPFKLHNNIYFIGSSKVSVHFIKSTEGLILIDSGYPDMMDIITDGIRSFGFLEEDISAILLTHGHIDHTGCAIRLRELSGAKIYISEIDEKMLNEKKELSWATELGYDMLSDFNADILLRDNDILNFGDIKIRCVLTPGHTDGTMSFFINDGDIVTAMHGGAGLKSMYKSYLSKYNLSLDCRNKFIDSIARLKNENVDLVLGNHPYQNDTVGKLEKVKKGESVLDKSEWIRFLEDIEEKFNNMIKGGL